MFFPRGKNCLCSFCFALSCKKWYTYDQFSDVWYIMTLGSLELDLLAVDQKL